MFKHKPPPPPPPSCNARIPLQFYVPSSIYVCAVVNVWFYIQVIEKKVWIARRVLSVSASCRFYNYFREEKSLKFVLIQFHNLKSRTTCLRKITVVLENTFNVRVTIWIGQGRLWYTLHVLYKRTPERKERTAKDIDHLYLNTTEVKRVKLRRLSAS